MSHYEIAIDILCLLFMICSIFVLCKSTKYENITKINNCKIIKNLGNGYYDIEIYTNKGKEIKRVKSLYDKTNIKEGSIISLRKIYSAYYI